MARDYGSLGRRNQSAGWQWFAFGTVMGLLIAGCLVATFLGVIAFELITIPGITIGPSPQPVVQVITATPQPATATLPPSETPIPSPTTQPPTAGVVVPTATAPGLSIDEPPIGGETTTGGAAAGDPAAGGSGAPTAAGGVAGSVSVAPTEAPAAVLNPDLVGDPDAQGSGAAPPASLDAPAQAAGEVPAVLELLQSQLVSIDGGQFQMGTTIQEAAEAVRECTDVFGGACTLAMAEDSAPPRPVQLSPYQMEQTEVTYEQYMAFLNVLGPRSHLTGCGGEPCLETRNESETSNVSFDGQTYDVPDAINNVPIVSVTWYGARSYCEALGRRLPTEAEWEYAARGPNGNIYPWGSGPFDTARAKTNRPIPENPLEVGAVPVGSYPTGASPFGLLDMSGNVAEWVQDWYGPAYYAQPDAAGLDPQGPLGGTDRSIRGGSWDAVPFFARAVHRQHLPPNSAEPWLGFRCAADPDTGATAGTGSQGNAPIAADPVTPDPATLGLGPVEPADSRPTLEPAGAAEEEPLATLSP